MKIDTLCRVEVPEGTAFRLHVAGAPARAMAFAYDLIIRSVAYFALLMAAGFLAFLIDGRLIQALLLIVFFLLEWFYPVVFEVWSNGQTPGKKWVGLQVVCTSGQPVNLQESLIRNFLRAVDFLPFAWGFGLASILTTRHAQRLGDLAAGTLVIYSEPAVRHPASTGDEHRPLPPRLPLTRDEQHALAAFADRQTTWTTERQIELADHAAALSGARGAEGRDRLLAMARWLQEGAR